MNRYAMLGLFGLTGAVALSMLGIGASAQCCKQVSGSNQTVSLGAFDDKDKSKIDTLANVYPLDTCPISGEKLGSMGEPVVKKYDEREVRFCCASCVEDFESDKVAQWKKVDEQIVKQQLAYYPSDTCFVSGDKLGGDMGEPINYVWRNRLVRLCCKGCIKDLNAEPQKYITKLDEAIIAKQREKYPLQTCVVSGEKLGSMGKPVETIVANRFVRLCCADCQPKLKATPATYLAKLNDAWKAGGEKPSTQPPTGKDDDQKDHNHGDHDH